jgi:hypothetical protein
MHAVFSVDLHERAGSTAEGLRAGTNAGILRVPLRMTSSNCNCRYVREALIKPRTPNVAPEETQIPFGNDKQKAAQIPFGNDKQKAAQIPFGNDK